MRRFWVIAAVALACCSGCVSAMRRPGDTRESLNAIGLADDRSAADFNAAAGPR